MAVATLLATRLLRVRLASAILRAHCLLCGRFAGLRPSLDGGPPYFPCRDGPRLPSPVEPKARSVPRTCHSMNWVCHRTSCGPSRSWVTNNPPHPAASHSRHPGRAGRAGRRPDRHGQDGRFHPAHASSTAGQPRPWRSSPGASPGADPDPGAGRPGGRSIIKYAHHLPFRTLIAYGGVSIKPNLDAIKLGVDILVATPGRLLDLLTQGALTLSALEVLVLDEADRMLDMGFITDIRRSS